MNRKSKLTESDLQRIVNKVLTEKKLNEGPFSSVGDFYRGVKGMKRGYGMDYFRNMSRLERLIKKLKKLDEPNIKVITELQNLKNKVSALGMPQSRKDAIIQLIDNSVNHFNMYSQINDQILAQIRTLDMDSWK